MPRMETTAAQAPLVLKFAGSLVEQLGAQLYPRVTATVAELVSNAWDADAGNVWITMPFGEKWGPDVSIEVLDDGHGMTREEAANKYLIVGRNRRKVEGSETTPGGRPLHGRKGIGKLAAFGTAGWLECVTLRDGKPTAFAIDYEEVRHQPPTKDYEVEPVPNPELLAHPETGESLEHGTRVRLTKLRAKRRTSERTFRQSMARRFALSAVEMRVSINGEPLERFDYEVEIRFPRDGAPSGVKLEVGEDGWAREDVDYSSFDGEGATREVSWWIGFTANPIADEDMRGVSILSRGKLAQRPFMFEAAQGTTGQLGQEYLVGEVRADWIDHGLDTEEDLIQSNRDQLQLDNEELAPLLDWGRDRLRWALAQRNRVRRDRRTGPGALGSTVEAVLAKAPGKSRERMRTLAGRIADVTQADERDLARALEAVLDATDSGAARRSADKLRLVADPDDHETWNLLRDAAEAAADPLAALATARTEALEQFLLAVAEPPVTRLHRSVTTDPWVVSPLLTDLPRRMIHEDDRSCAVTFGAQPPVLAALTVVCWAVGENAGDLPDAVDASAPHLVIASEWAEPDAHRFTWEATLRHSLEAHRAIVAAVEAS